jgi:hypothetical protein
MPPGGELLLLTMPVAPPVSTTVRVEEGWNVAVTDVSACSATVQVVAVPHPELLHPARTDPGPAVAVSVTKLPSL